MLYKTDMNLNLKVPNANSDRILSKYGKKLNLRLFNLQGLS